ncbi:MAG: 4-(cytidine 5'-diphospho)-2-C-methyl-D-erythritol kinase [Gammaproteobacteria bacterium]|nr:4-(cytidine 5'-diphospho)-2-C-methyl-D-erythritol kinase [Gammaproteobacteria bacterium]MBU1653319.1 4-(cytidine 5'-diphospho)-2-C-methyl-D-erythritol kinase [Gammaproteobacteria bacterium]MBU1961073.1 4-(cytidine 5'-diphospho)-2-C-methyl-D-erythritol kinase [Gammaproteobacteria bacterium]
MTTRFLNELKAWPAPAKLNLMLRVVGRRGDGYHLLQTVFQFLEFGDSLRFRPREDGCIQRLSLLDGVAEEADLTVRAARLLQREAGCGQGVDIAVEKRIPLGGGLGGGSSDAATVLVALNLLWDLKLTDDDLAALGLRLGADVPVFVRGHAAWAEGVGERLEPLILPEPWFLVLFPGCHVVTADVFQAPELTRDAAPITIADFISGEVSNACEPVVRRRRPEVDRALCWLSGYGAARLTGTGGCVFAAFDDQAEAERAYQAAIREGYFAFVSRGANVSPLRKLLCS